MKTTHLIATVLILSLVGAPTLSFAKARGGSGGGYTSGSRGTGSAGMGSRGSRTYENNGARPIERSTTLSPSANPEQPAPARPAPAPQPAPAVQPSFLQQHPFLAGMAGGLAGSWIGHMLFGATDSAARTTDADAHEKVRDSENSTGPFGSPGLLILLMLLGAGAVYYFMRMRGTPQPDFSGLTRSTLRDVPVERITTGGL